MKQIKLTVDGIGMGQPRATKLMISLGVLAILVSLGLFAPALAKVKIVPVQAPAPATSSPDKNKNKSKNPSVDISILPHPDRETLKQLKDAHYLIQKERFGEAVRILGNILSSPNDSFFLPKTPSVGGALQIRGLHDEAEQILGTLPRRAIELYELQFGSQAKRLLEKAIHEGDARAPADISRRYFYTAAGTEATWLSGLASMDEGRWKAALLAFTRFEKIPAAGKRREPLLSLLKAICMDQAGEHESADETWETLRRRTPKASLQVAGKATRLFLNSGETFEAFLARTDLSELGPSGLGPSELDHSGNLLATLTTDRTLPFGTPQRNASVNAGLPLLKRAWRARITDRPLAETMLRKQREACIDSGTLTIPRFYPLVVDGVLFGRTLTTLIAIDTTTGKRLWEAGFEKTDKNAQALLAMKNAQALLAMNRHPANFLQNLVRRIWTNSIFGQLSSDTRNVYAIEEVSVSSSSSNARQQQALLFGMMPGMGRNQAEGPCNALVAFDAKTGHRRWTRSTGVDDSPLFFLGPPLPLDGSLYALAESQGEILLVVIAAASGEVDWSQRIAVVEKPAARHMNRNTVAQNSTARMPAVDDGIMICPTGAGAIIAIEPTTRALLWAHCYERLGKRQNRVVFVNGIPRGQNQDRIGEEILLHDGCVFSVPIDSSYLYCLDLHTGKELWKKDFTGGSFLGAVYKDRLLVVGSKKFQTLSIKDGKTITTSELNKSLGQDDSVLITGRGFRNEAIYYAPTSSHHIVGFDIQKGKITQQTCTREPIILGNLVAIDDRIFSQSLDGLEAFHQLKSIREKTEKQLQENPDNLTAIAMQGELLLAEEKIDLAIEKFRHVHRAQPTPTSSVRLFKAFCIGLEEAYPQYRDVRPEIESLLQTEEQKSEYWYLCIRGEIAENNLEAATDACFQLAKLAGKSQSMLSIGRHHTVRQDRFVQAELATIYERLDAQGQKKLGHKILAQLEVAIRSDEPLDLHRAWDCYASLPPVIERYNQITEQLWKTDPLFAEMILERTIRFGKPREAATAMVRWAELLRSSDRIDEAAACYREAIRQWKEVPLLTDSHQTAYTKIAAMPSDDPVRSRLLSRDVWPQGHEIEKPETIEQKNRFQNIHSRVHLNLVGTPSPIFRDKQILSTGQMIELRDQYNRKVWSLSLADEGNQNTIHYGQQGIRCSTLGHMIFLELPTRLIAINAWDPKQPKIAWQTERGSTVSIPGMSTTNSSFCRMHFSGLTQGMFSHNRTTLGIPGLDFGFQLLTLSGTELIALNPFDGSPLWSQRKIPNQIDFNSDGTTLFVSQPNQRNEPPSMIRLVDGSRKVLTKNKPPAKTTLSAKNATKNAKHNKNVPQGKNTKETRKEELARKAGELAAQLFMSSKQRNRRPPQKILSLGRNMLAFNRISQKFSFSLVDSLTQKPIWAKSKTYSYRSKWGLLDRDYIGIIDPKGNFELFRITDGKTLIRQKLKLDGTLQGLFLQSLGDRVGVIVSTRPKSTNQNNSVSYIPITQYLQQGRIYTFHWDGRPGMTKHKDGVLIKQQGFLANPPAKLPVITLLSQNYHQKNQKKPWLTKLQVIDSRSGETILSKELDTSIQSFELTGNPEENMVEYQLNDQKFTIGFK